jgi:hypothetical protein
MTAARPIRMWYEYALQQIAAESYLHHYDWKNAVRLREGLERGTANPDFPTVEAFTRMTASQAKWFVDNYEVIDHRPNTTRGISATLLRDKLTGAYTLSFRPSEYKDPLNCE